MDGPYVSPLHMGNILEQDIWSSLIIEGKRHVIQNCHINASREVYSHIHFIFKVFRDLEGFWTCNWQACQKTQI